MQAPGSDNGDATWTNLNVLVTILYYAVAGHDAVAQQHLTTSPDQHSVLCNLQVIRDPD